MDEILVADSGLSFILVSLLGGLGMVAPLGKATKSRTVRFVNTALLTNLTGDNIGGGGWLSILPPT